MPNRQTFARMRSSRTSIPAAPSGAFLISTIAPSPRQKTIAFALTVLLGSAFLGSVAFRDVQLRRVDSFVPIANTIICLNDVITASLLYAQFSITRTRALLPLASGFLFTALIMLPHELSFPGAFAPGGLLGGVQTTALLYLSQHTVFLIGAIAYTLLRDRPQEAPARESSAAVPIVVAVLAVVTGVVSLAWLFAAGTPLLPPIMADAIHTSASFRRIMSPFMLLQAVVSVFVFRRRSTSMIDLWVKIAMESWLIETLLTAIVQTRFSLVFYVSRTMGVVSSSVVLLVFLSESMMLHRRLVITLIAREREREGQRTAIDIVVSTLAHELRQPLTAILMNERAAVRMLPPAPAGPREELPAILEDIRVSVLRANEIIDSVRTMFAAAAGHRELLDANAIVSEAVDLMRIELETHRVAVSLDLSPELPSIPGHHGQLLEVLLNGLKNAVESLAAVLDRNRDVTLRTARLDADAVAISIEDSGTGFDPRDRHRAFEPFYSTKPRGMGLGLSICEAIVSAQGGTLSLLPRSPHGAVLRIALRGSSAVTRSSITSPTAAVRNGAGNQALVDLPEPMHRSVV